MQRIIPRPCPCRGAHRDRIAPTMADELDFSALPAAHNTVQGTAQSTAYSPKLALEFFRATGTVEVKPAAKPIFSENEKSGGFFSKGARMYLLLDGEIGLMIHNKFFGVVKAGEIFGELAVIAGVPRSATAMAKTECKVLSLDEKQFHAALQKTPEFALMMMSSMGQRMRQSIARLGAGTASAPPAERADIIDRKMLQDLARFAEQLDRARRLIGVLWLTDGWKGQEAGEGRGDDGHSDQAHQPLQRAAVRL